MTTASSVTTSSVAENTKIKADDALAICVKSWFAFAMFGQLFFGIYVLFRYGIPLYMGTPEDINIGPGITGFVEGDFSGNSMLFIHVISASTLSFCGILQLVPSLRQKYPALHRFNGRLFLLIGLTGALVGLYLTWLRGTRLSDIGSIGVTLNGILIPIAIYCAWRYAIMGKIQLHQRWAVHAFFLVNGVWSLRLMVAGWVLLTGGYGLNRTLDGPANMFFSFACYLLPMALAELYFWAKRQQPEMHKWLAVAGLGIGSLITLGGVCSAILIMWLPRINAAISGL